MASATAAALPHLRLRVVATASGSPSSSSCSYSYSYCSPSYSCRLFLYPALLPRTSNALAVSSCSALSLRTRRHGLFAGEKKGKGRRNVVVASLFGVGAPEALVIGVVALLVFGPKGLAEVARNLGKTLREFQPTIRELQEVSKEFKSTLEREIGLDEVASSSPANYNNSTTGTTTNQSPVLDPNGKPPTTAYSSEELLKVTEEQLAASASASASTATATADAPPPTTDSEVPEDTADSSKSSEVTPPDAVPVETAAVATSSEGTSESSSETSEKTSK